MQRTPKDDAIATNGTEFGESASRGATLWSEEGADETQRQNPQNCATIGDGRKKSTKKTKSKAEILTLDVIKCEFQAKDRRKKSTKANGIKTEVECLES